MNFKRFKLVFMPIFILGCGACIPGAISPIGPFAPGTYSGTVKIKVTQYETGKANVTEEVESISTETINHSGMLCNMNGEPIAEGMVLQSNLGGVSSNQTVQGVSVSTNGITIVLSGSMTVNSPTLGTISGQVQQRLTYTYIDERSLEYKVLLTAGDNTGKYAMTVQGSGVLRK
jgi:hypothetical protein